MLFRDIIGQEELKEKLLLNARSGRIPHAQLFLGPEGSGNLALALAYAQYLSCEQPGDTDACGVCNSCNKFQKMIHPDLHFSFPMVGEKVTSNEFLPQWRNALAENPYLNVFDWLQLLGAENKQGNIPVGECREIIKKLGLKSFESEYKFLVMWMPEYLGKEGNTLLKIIEEPPFKTIFLLVANTQEMILPTILSRTQLVKIPRLRDADIVDALLTRREATETQARNISFLCEGDYNQARKLMTETEDSYFLPLRTWFGFCYQNNMAEAARWGDENAKMGRENLKHFLVYAIRMLRECMVIKTGAGHLARITGDEEKFAANFSRILSEKQLELLINELNDAAYYIERNANPKIILFDLSLRLKNVFVQTRSATQT